ncbi:MAG: membrane integrity-associated transporter subunit PqiC [Magnetococcales bacterium]|nr:membrane integrity-associated transporter subunit PqiC [Magnetococcales bacterium]MBF0114475.1 membrane integrity-associated transporter subunit PqiC [Magnetococcales bacterium]
MHRYSLMFRPALWVVLLLLSGCVTGSPPVRYYLLTPKPALGTIKTATGQTPLLQQPLLVIEPVELPPYLNRAHIVTRSSSNHLQLAQFEQWGDTLRDNISRVLLENLSNQLEGIRVSPPTALLQERPSYRLASQIGQFELGPDNRVTLQARWRLLDSQNSKTVLSEQSRFMSEPLNPSDHDGLAASMSDLLYRWSQEMASVVQVQLR